MGGLRYNDKKRVCYIIAIELVWHSAKEYLAHREFKTREELEYRVNQMLNEGELIINWSKKFKNKGNAISAI